MNKYLLIIIISLISSTYIHQNQCAAAVSTELNLESTIQKSISEILTTQYQATTNFEARLLQLRKRQDQIRIQNYIDNRDNILLKTQSSLIHSILNENLEPYSEQQKNFILIANEILERVVSVIDDSQREFIIETINQWIDYQQEFSSSLTLPYAIKDLSSGDENYELKINIHPDTYISLAKRFSIMQQLHNEKEKIEWINRYGDEYLTAYLSINDNEGIEQTTQELNADKLYYIHHFHELLDEFVDAQNHSLNIEQLEINQLQRSQELSQATNNLILQIRTQHIDPYQKSMASLLREGEKEKYDRLTLSLKEQLKTIIPLLNEFFLKNKITDGFEKKTILYEIVSQIDAIDKDTADIIRDHILSLYQ